MFVFTGPSSPPLNLTVATTGPNTLTASWLPPSAIDVNGDLILYTIQYGLANSTSILGRQELEGTTQTLTLFGLNNFTMYTVFVAAQTIVGEGPPAVMNGTTAENGNIKLY